MDKLFLRQMNELVEFLRNYTSLKSTGGEKPNEPSNQDEEAHQGRKYSKD